MLEEGRETAIIPLPLYHVFALTATLTFCRLGAHVVLITDPRDTASFIKELRHTPFSVMIGVNTLFKVLLNAPELRQVNTGGVKLVGGRRHGGAARRGRTVAAGVRRAADRRLRADRDLAHRRAPTRSTCASSPAASACRSRRPRWPSWTRLATSWRKARPAKSACAARRSCKATGTCRKKPPACSPRDGWLRTGDIGFMDEQGYFKLIERKKDIIVVSGFKVYPSEVEEVVGMYPGVLEVAAIRAADEHSDEVVKIIVVPSDPDLSAAALIEYCRKTLAGYKVPKYVVFRDTPLPKSNIGKILRRVVMEEEARRAAAAPAAAAMTGRASTRH